MSDLLLPSAPVPVAPGTSPRRITGQPTRPRIAPTSRTSTPPRARRRPFTPPPETLATEDLPNLVRQLLTDARAARSPMVARWRRNYLYLRNRPNALPSNAGRSVPQVPEIFPIIASKVGYKIDRRFTHRVSASPEIGSSFYRLAAQLASDLSTVLDATWHTNMEEAEVTKAIWDSEVYGTGILKTSWELNLAGGLGDAAIRAVDPFTFYPDPSARSLHDCSYMVEARHMSVQEMDRRWPGSARRLNGETYIENFNEAPSQIGSTHGVPRANPGTLPTASDGSGSNLFFPSKFRAGRNLHDSTSDPGVTVLECWMREHETIEDANTPFGFRVEDKWRVVVVAGNHVLMDAQADELFTHGTHPYSRVVPHDIGEFWGFSTVELLIPSQASINRLLSALVISVELTGNPVWKESANSGLQRTAVVNRPGQRLTVNNANTVAEWVQPPSMSAQAPELIRYFLGRMEAVSGLSAITKGENPGGRQAQAAFDAMQEAAHVRVRMELRQLEYALRDAGNKKAALIIDNYTTPRQLSILGPGGKDSTMQLAQRHFYLPGPDGEAPLNYNLLVDAGASQATSQRARKEDAMMLYSMGVVDEMYVMDVFDVPGREEIFKRLEYKKAAGTYQPPGARQRAHH